MRLIDADALIEILTTAIRNVKGMAKFICAEDDPEIKMEIKAYTYILECVKEQPTIEPKTPWIPFDERMPENGQDILVTIHWQEVEDEYFVQFDIYDDDATLDSNFKIGRDAFAWMPKPEPYREEDD